MARRKTTGRSRSLKRPAVYDELRQQGYSKEKAARISNAGTTHIKRVRMAKKAARTRKARGR
jgi:hypothetical protein